MDLVSFLCLDELSYFFLNLGQLPTFYFLHFQCHGISPRVPLIRLIYLFVFAASSSLQQASSSGYVSRISWTAAASIFPGQVLLYNNIWLNYNCQPYHIFFLYLLTNYLFRLFISVKCHVGLSLGDGGWGVSHNYMLVLSLYDNRCTVTSHWETLKESLIWLVPDHDTHL